MIRKSNKKPSLQSLSVGPKGQENLTYVARQTILLEENLANSLYEMAVALAAQDEGNAAKDARSSARWHTVGAIQLRAILEAYGIVVTQET